MFGFFDMEIYDAKIEIYIGDKLVQSDTLQSPSILIKQNYMNLLQQIISDNRPITTKLLVKNDIFDDNGNYIRTLCNSVEHSNYERKYDE